MFFMILFFFGKSLFNVKELLPLYQINVIMERIGFILLGFFMFSQVVAQENNVSVKQEVVLQKVDKQSDMAFVYLNDVLVEKGLLVNGKREGLWQSFNPNGTLAVEATFSKGMKQGLWVVYDATELKYVLHYDQDVRVKVADLAQTN
jgi:antitoxin component YwqK of YwqJK toxin-antitoxin module